ncbi:MAG: metalloregulator ArsR/SmtB family transcription factor [Chloroflexota bacterium]
MPRLTAVKEQTTGTENAVEFVLSVPLDLMNTMYFTHLVVASEGVEGFPVEVRKHMARDLLAELDFLFSAPIEQPGIAGTLADHLWSHPETWGSVDDLLNYVRNLPLGVTDDFGNIGVRSLFFNTFCLDLQVRFGDISEPTRENLAKMVEREGGNVDEMLALWDDPATVRDRLALLISRFYNEHYKAELPNRWPCLERSVAAHRSTTMDNVVDVMRGVLGRDTICIEAQCAGEYKRLLFAPSVDMGPYASCAVLPGVHGMFYPCESIFVHGNDDAQANIRMARIYKALGDEQRLRMLEMLREGEMYVQEIVDRTGLHQSVVSRHLSFLKAVGLLDVRKQNNMKFYSLRPGLQKSLDMFSSPLTEGGLR